MSNINSYKNINMCSIFSLITSFNFLNNFDTSKDQHMQNLIISRENYQIEKIKHDISFKDLLKKYTNLNNNLINLTNPNLIKGNIISYEHIFLDEPHCIIFMKNNNFFVVMYKKSNGMYYLRESHIDFQQNFKNRDNLIDYLNSIYYFNKYTTIGDYIVEELSNIEYIVLKDNFELKLSIKSINDILDRLCFKEDKKLKISFHKLKDIKKIPDNEDKDETIIFKDIFRK